MAELVLLSLDKFHFDALYLMAERGDQPAIDEINAMWDDHRHKELACFLCDAVVEDPIYAQMLPEYRDKGKLIAAPLCLKCRALPRMWKLGKCISLLKKLYKASSGGKTINFSFAPLRTHPR